jgi:hypothetical protein
MAKPVELRPGGPSAICPATWARGVVANRFLTKKEDSLRRILLSAVVR